jgi:hypothetical protein
MKNVTEAATPVRPDGGEIDDNDGESADTDDDSSNLKRRIKRRIWGFAAIAAGTAYLREKQKEEN